MGTRVRKVEEAVRRVIADMLLFGNIRDPRVQGKAGSIGITGVKVSPDLSVAHIYVDLQGCTGNETQRVIDGLKSAAGTIRREVGKKIPMRRIPELVFERDSSIDHGLAIERVLTELREQKDPGGEPEQSP
ncbi:MAG: 30S ribosome-binding factor RbfA [Nannocystaceae bacterium]